MHNDALFFIAIIPPNPLKEEVQEIKKSFSIKYNVRHALKSPPHITLIPPFKTKQENEKKLSDVLEDFVESRHGVDIELDGYGCFKPRVIFLNPLMSNELRSLHEALADVFYTCFPYLTRPDRQFHPHLSIAFRDLKPKQFHQAWTECRHMQFKANFRADGVCLLKHDGQRWQEHRNFDFRAL